MKERLNFIGVYNGFALYVDLEAFPTPTQTTRPDTFSGAVIPTESEEKDELGADSPRD
ncbi:hypothetical protein [Meiothermus granaticius]|uniref:Uncharacterized protein n=1 Tax=Meiothermus granaticius NBRC 107808 TaxID=1227551 RepID=A0A399F944_9DEIN|nr:hypothetical protein [Meiothermus granaticius]RIH91779.1 hypothetical protein Mgrana_02356 [Meiothermus granaticius NBRC 107808]GEM88476.1 hypothetical protein MGR01S_31010 [Meiothermus granaticius NBRC 107808]